MHICNIIGYNFSKIYYFNNFNTICYYLCKVTIKSVTLFIKFRTKSPGQTFGCRSILGQVCIIQGVRASPVIETRYGSVAHM